MQSATPVALVLGMAVVNEVSNRQKGPMRFLMLDLEGYELEDVSR